MYNINEQLFNYNATMSVMSSASRPLNNNIWKVFYFNRRFILTSVDLKIIAFNRCKVVDNPLPIRNCAAVR